MAVCPRAAPLFLPAYALHCLVPVIFKEKWPQDFSNRKFGKNRENSFQPGGRYHTKGVGRNALNEPKQEKIAGIIEKGGCDDSDSMGASATARIPYLTRCPRIDNCAPAATGSYRRKRKRADASRLKPLDRATVMAMLKRGTPWMR
jgi:hypothetical protein